MEVEETDFVSIPTLDKERTQESDGETRDAGVCRTAFFVGPDGNDLMLHHRYASHAS